MKNLVILGASRAGKTTLARKICEIYPNYHLINGDSIRSAFQKTLPQNNINKYNGAGMKDDFAKFCASYFRNQINRNKDYFNYIFDSCDVSVENALKYFQNDDSIIIFLGYADIGEKEAFDNYRRYENLNDWTVKRTDEELLFHAKTWILNSKTFKEDCLKYKIPYVDTSFKREEVLKTLVSKLLLELPN